MSTGREVFSCNICGTVYSRTIQNWTDNCPNCGANPGPNATLISSDDDSNYSSSEGLGLFGWIIILIAGWFLFS